MNNINNNQEEADLGQLFNAIGRLFKRFFEFIGDILYKIFLAVVWLIFLIKKNWIVIGSAIILGFVLGVFLLKTGDPIYRSSAVLKQNYPVGDNLYATIDYYNGLIGEQQIKTLAESLGISEDEAQKIINFELSTEFDANEKMEVYNEYFEEKDTTLMFVAEFDQFAKNLNDYDHEFQNLSIKFKDRGLFNKTLNGLVQNLNSIEYFKKLQQKDIKEIEQRQNMIKRSLAQSDSLKKVYQRVLQSENPSESQTSITIDNGQNRRNITREFELYMNDIELMNELVDLERKKDDLDAIVEVISTNNNVGTRYTDKKLLGISLNLKYYYTVLFFALTLLFLLAKEFLKYLEHFKKNI